VADSKLWPWLKHMGFADDGDDTELRRFLDEFLGRRPAHMRPGLRFRRVWTFAEAAELGSALAETIRNEFDAVFAIAHEPMLSSRETVGREARMGVSARTASSHITAFVREAIPKRVRHEVWLRDQGRCVDCGSRERLEFDYTALRPGTGRGPHGASRPHPARAHARRDAPGGSSDGARERQGAGPAGLLL
jgi:hypothetical protein